MLETIIFDAQENNGEWIESTCGVVVTQSGMRPSIHLFEIEENSGVPLSDNLLQACPAILDQLYPDLSLRDIDWRLTKGIYDSTIEFKEKNGTIIEVNMSNKPPFGPYFQYPIDIYREALSDDNGFENYLSSGHGFVKTGRLVIVPVYLPKSPKSYTLFKKAYDHDPAYKYILADCAKLLDAWKQQTPAIEHVLKEFRISAEDIRRTHWGSGYDSVLLTSSLESSLDHISGQSIRRIQDMPHMSYYPDEMRLKFTNGRHRLFNVINAGAQYVPVEMHEKSGLDLFRRTFEWNSSHDLKAAPIAAYIPPKNQFNY